jgi:signal transduction histidine kinase
LTGSQASSILTFDPDYHCLRFLVAPQLDLEQIKPLRIPLEDSVAGWVYRHAEPLMLEHTVDDQRIFRAVDEKTGFETASIAAVPIVFKGAAIGVLEAVNKTDFSHYTGEDLAILETLASQAAIAIHTQHLLDQSQAAYAQLAELDQMKSDFIAITSHELRTPLGLILGHAAYLRENAAEELIPQLDIILRSAMRLKDIVEEFSNIREFEKGAARFRRHQVALDSLILETAYKFRELAGQRGVNLRTDVSKAGFLIEGDFDKLSEALGHLVRNALTFTDTDDLVLISCEQIPGYIKIMVTDNGIGIPAKELQSIFERFYQVDDHLTRKHGGLGLGLSICKEIVEAHGGRIWVESLEGKGSRFSFILPHNPPKPDVAAKVFVD